MVCFVPYHSVPYKYKYGTKRVQSNSLHTPEAGSVRFLVFDYLEGTAHVVSDCLPQAHFASGQTENGAHHGRHHRGRASGPREPVVLPHIELAFGPMNNGPLGVLAICNLDEREKGVFGGAREMFGWLRQQPLSSGDGVLIQGFLRSDEPLLARSGLAFHTLPWWFQGGFNDPSPAPTNLLRAW